MLAVSLNMPCKVLLWPPDLGHDIMSGQERVVLELLKHNNLIIKFIIKLLCLRIQTPLNKKTNKILIITFMYV